MHKSISVTLKTKPNDSASAIQFLGDENKFDIVFFFKGFGKYQVEFKINKTPMITVHKLEPKEYTLKIGKFDWVINFNGTFVVYNDEQFREKFVVN